ncbi:MAG: GntR family transcriptional regulator [Leucobacter sp.]
MSAPVSLSLPRQQVSLRERVVEVIRNNILYGTFEPGQKLVERDLCESLDVSRALLREALQALQAEGLITNVVHKGPYVSVISRDEAQDIYQARLALEQAAAYDFALNATDEQIEQLAATVAELHTCGEGSDPHELLRIKNDFYACLLEGCGNRVFGQLLTLLNNRTTLLRRISLSQPGRLAGTLAELDAIVEAVRARNAEEASRLTGVHVSNAAALVLAGFDAKEERKGS